MQKRKILIAVLAVSMLLSVTGCGAGGQVLRSLGRMIEKRAEERNEEKEDAIEEAEVFTESGQEEASPEKKIPDLGMGEDTLENSEDKEEQSQEKPPTKEGVTSLDDIFSGESGDEEQDDPGYTSGGYEDEMLSYDEFVAANLEKCKSDLAADEGSVQSEVDSDTVQWLNATYAIITENNSGDRKLVGGMERNTANAVFMRYQLYTGWGIEDKESADETLEWLRSEGHRQEFVEYVEVFKETGLLSLGEEEFNQTIQEAFGEFGAYALNTLKTVYICHKACGENGILAWDLCRLNQVTSWCYVAGYYTLDEALEIQYQNALLMQNSFSSWDEMMESYLYGFQYWNGDSSTSEFSDTAKRRNIYNSLMELTDGPYQYDFKSKLQRSWKVEE